MPDAERRSTTVHDRYQITDSCCGQVGTATTLKTASALAEAHARRHGNDPDNTVTFVEVFDRMARRDCQTLWSFNVPSHPPDDEGPEFSECERGNDRVQNRGRKAGGYPCDAS